MSNHIPISPRKKANLEAPALNEATMPYRRRSSFDWNSAKPTNAIWSVMGRTRVSQVAPTREHGTVVIPANKSVDEVVKLLSTKRILSAPLLNDKKECVGFIDMVDILKYVVNVAPDIMDGIPTSDLKKTPMTAMMTRHSDQVFVAVPSNAFLTQLIKAFANDIHRVAVTDKNQYVVTTVSQSDVTRFIRALMKGEKIPEIIVSPQESKIIQEMATKSLSELGYRHSVHQLVTINHNAPVLKALQLLQQKHVNSVALVDDSGILVGNFSASDLRGLYTDQFPHFLHGIKEFLVRHSPSSVKNVLIASPSSTLGELVDTMMNNSVHHLWVVNADKRPTGIICLTDVMKIVGTI